MASARAEIVQFSGARTVFPFISVSPRQTGELCGKRPFSVTRIFKHHFGSCGPLVKLANDFCFR